MQLEIGGRRLGPGEPLFAVAEIGLNHGGSVDEALRMVAAAASAGASAVKFQSLKADTLVAPSCPAPAHVTAANLAEFFRTFELDADAHAVAAREARRLGLAFLSTPFDLQAVEMLERLDCDAYKIASGDITNVALIARVAATGRPIVMSTGMSGTGDVEQALTTIRRHHGGPVVLLHCVSSYPVPHDSQNLRAIATLATRFGVPVGLSDHGTDPTAVIMAVTLGAVLYEKHFMLPGQAAIDAAVSADPEQFAALVQAAARTHAALGDGRKRCLPAESPNVVPSRRSVYATRDLRAGDVITADAIAVLRPAAGLEPRFAPDLIGRHALRDVAAGSPFRLDDLAGSPERSTTHVA